MDGAGGGRILVTGGTGTLGQLVVPRLQDAGRTVRVLSRRGRDTVERVEGVEVVTGDLVTGDGVDAAVRGAETIVHCAGSAKGDEDKARTLVGAAERAGTTHLVFVSVVGADRIPVVSALDRALFGYFASKGAAERVIEDSGVPWTTLRATQFHDLLFSTVAQMARLPVIPTPSGFRFQPVDADEVAARLVDCALGRPAGLVPDVAGPGVHAMADLIRGYLHARGLRRPVVGVRIPGRAARAIRSGANLSPGGVGRTWEQFLADRLRSPTDGRSGMAYPPTRT